MIRYRYLLSLIGLIIFGYFIKVMNDEIIITYLYAKYYEANIDNIISLYSLFIVSVIIAFILIYINDTIIHNKRLLALMNGIMSILILNPLLGLICIEFNYKKSLMNHIINIVSNMTFYTKIKISFVIFKEGIYLIIEALRFHNRFLLHFLIIPILLIIIHTIVWIILLKIKSLNKDYIQ